MKINRWQIFWAFLVLPASTNFKMEGIMVGNAGGGNVGSSNYAIEGSLGEMAGLEEKGINYDLGAGLAFVRQSNVPRAASFTNENDSYNRLHLVIDGQGSPGDTLYLIAVSPDDFVTTYYVRPDQTLGLGFDINDYQTYSLWGGDSGFDILGLESNTSYKIKIRSRQGKYTESDFGPTAMAATSEPKLTFDIDVSPTDTQTEPPYVVSLGDLYPGNVITGSDKVWISVDTNGESGSGVYIYAKNGGLLSLAAGYTISAVNGDLNSLPAGFGVQAEVTGQSQGGPLMVDDGYSGSGNIVGLTDVTVRQILRSDYPLTGGRASLVVKAKSDNDVPAAGDYSETLTVVASANF